MKNLIRVSWLITLFSMGVSAQGICVPDTFEVKTPTGKVMAHLDKRDEPLSGISIILFKEGKKAAIKETLTDKNGMFQFGKLKRGSYSLIASYPNLANFYLNLLVSDSKSKKTDEEIIIWLDADFLKPCSGSYAE